MPLGDKKKEFLHNYSANSQNFVVYHQCTSICRYRWNPPLRISYIEKISQFEIAYASSETSLTHCGYLLFRQLYHAKEKNFHSRFLPFLNWVQIKKNKKISTQYTYFLQKRVNPSNENWVKLCFNFVLIEITICTIEIFWLGDLLADFFWFFLHSEYRNELFSNCFGQLTFENM